MKLRMSWCCYTNATDCELCHREFCWVLTVYFCGSGSIQLAVLITTNSYFWFCSKACCCFRSLIAWNSSSYYWSQIAKLELLWCSVCFSVVRHGLRNVLAETKLAWTEIALNQPGWRVQSSSNCCNTRSKSSMGCCWMMGSCLLFWTKDHLLVLSLWRRPWHLAMRPIVYQTLASYTIHCGRLSLIVELDDVIKEWIIIIVMFIVVPSSDYTT